MTFEIEASAHRNTRISSRSGMMIEMHDLTYYYLVLSDSRLWSERMMRALSFCDIELKFYDKVRGSLKTSLFLTNKNNTNPPEVV